MPNKQELLKTAVNYLYIIVGLALTALGLDLFLVPNKIAAGGVSGIAVILHYVFNVPVGGSMLVMNFFLFLIGFSLLGKKFGLRTIIASGLLSVFIDFFAWILPWKTLTGDLLIAAIFGDILTGIGMAIVFNRNASTGGTDIIARILNHFFKINIGKCLLFIDFLVAIGAGVCLKSFDVAMYSLLSVLINCFTIDMFIDSLNISKRVMIVSPESRRIAEIALVELDRGGTFLPCIGAYKQHPGELLMMVIRPRQTAKLREIVRSIDPDAFMIVSNVNQVLGRGFKSISDPTADI